MRNAANRDRTETAALPVKPTAESAYRWDTGDADNDGGPYRLIDANDPSNPGRHRVVGTDTAIPQWVLFCVPLSSMDSSLS